MSVHVQPGLGPNVFVHFLAVSAVPLIRCCYRTAVVGLRSLGAGVCVLGAVELRAVNAHRREGAGAVPPYRDAADVRAAALLPRQHHRGRGVGWCGHHAHAPGGTGGHQRDVSHGVVQLEAGQTPRVGRPRLVLFGSNCFAFSLFCSLFRTPFACFF